MLRSEFSHAIFSGGKLFGSLNDNGNRFQAGERRGRFNNVQQGKRGAELAGHGDAVRERFGGVFGKIGWDKNILETDALGSARLKCRGPVELLDNFGWHNGRSL